jgi:hypothetical protein
MDGQNSQVEFYLDLVDSLLRADPLQHVHGKLIQKDIDVLRHRVLHEGLSFLTKALPKLGKALDKGLSGSKLEVPRGFPLERNSSRPLFMGAYFSLVFSEDGFVRDEAEPAAVNHLRQVLFSCYKLEIPFQPSQERAVVAQFERTEEDLRLVSGDFDTPLLWGASYIVRDIFQDFDPRDISPRHGPGAVATGERLDQKWVFSRLYRDIHNSYPYYQYFMIGSRGELIDRKAWYTKLQRHDNGTAKVILVPKDSRGPRLISAEPLEYQWVQQGLGRKIIAHLESHWLTRGVINFTNQETNRSLALESSRTQEWVTLDLKDASDRVHVELVKMLFGHNPDLLKRVLGVRTSATTLPDGRVIPLVKYAPMGSAMCFPIMATCLWAIIVAAISRATGLPRASVGRLVYVYGDDIIVRREHYETAIRGIESAHLRVNRDKSCTEGHFRESCGMDAFRGVQVTPTRFKTLWTGKGTD